MGALGAFIMKCFVPPELLDEEQHDTAGAHDALTAAIVEAWGSRPACNTIGWGILLDLPAGGCNVPPSLPHPAGTALRWRGTCPPVMPCWTL